MNDFNTFWSAYPRKVGKLAAQRAYQKALKLASAVDIVTGLERAKPHWSDPKFIPHPASWLNAGRWMDEYETRKAVFEGWTCQHVDHCSHRAMCQNKLTLGPEKYPVNVAS